MRIFLLLLVFLSLKAEDLVTYDYELDFYYSNVSAFIDLDRERNVTDATNFSEYQIYKSLVSKTFSPNIFLVEASLHPMNILGYEFRKHNEELYKKGIINGFNIVKAVTAGWEEPYSLSLFLGRMMIFKNKNYGRIGKNRAYMGYLFTFGNKITKDNLWYKDNWYNFEFKLKGTRELKEKDLDWSFRIGARFHQNRDFANTYYIGARRSSIDFAKPFWSVLYNSSFDILAETTKELQLSQFQFIIGKKFPSRRFHITYGLDIGYLYYGNNRYRGDLRDEGVDNHQLILRPNIKF